jgi:SAM-dependent methyltransferase
MPLEKVTFMADWYERLVSRTNEKIILPQKIREFAQETRATNCLEIGLGTSPVFAIALCDIFDHYLIIEKENITPELPPKVTIAHENWESFSTTERFDVIIASHVMYYFDDKARGVEKIIETLSPNGKAYIVVNGRDGDYGPLKTFFSEQISHPYTFTYDELKKILHGRKYTEHSVSSTIKYSSPEDLFETLRLSFDQYPDEYEHEKVAMIKFFSNLNSRPFTINQKIFEVIKD